MHQTDHSLIVGGKYHILATSLNNHCLNLQLKCYTFWIIFVQCLFSSELPYTLLWGNSVKWHIVPAKSKHRTLFHVTYNQKRLHHWLHTSSSAICWTDKFPVIRRSFWCIPTSAFHVYVCVCVTSPVHRQMVLFKMGKLSTSQLKLPQPPGNSQLFGPPPRGKFAVNAPGYTQGFRRKSDLFWMCMRWKLNFKTLPVPFSACVFLNAQN